MQSVMAIGAGTGMGLNSAHIGGFVAGIEMLEKYIL